MDRGLESRLLAWMLLPVSAALVLSALSLPRQPYTGLSLRGDQVVATVPGGPAERAGLMAGDRILPYSESRGATSTQNPLAQAAPGEPLLLLRERAGHLTEVRLTPATLPDGDRRMMAMLLMVACGFMVVGGWVWGERRDGLTRAFYLMCVAFALMLAPLPRFRSPWASGLYDTFYAAATLFLPSLFVHFFALFPGMRRLGGRARAGTMVAYGVSVTLFAASVALTAVSAAGWQAADAAAALLQGVAGLWFAVGCLSALILFARSYARRQSADARRRLRVALLGVIVGAAPLAAVIAWRNLFPAHPIPGERWSVPLTLLVPISFAWATAVHRIFEFRVAARAMLTVAALALVAGLVYLTGEWLAAVWGTELGAGLAGGALACAAFAASAAGPANAGLKRLSARLVPGLEEPSLGEWSAPPPLVRAGRPDGVLLAACDVARRSLRLDGCAAWVMDPAPRTIVDPATATCLEPDVAIVGLAASSGGVTAADDPRLSAAERERLASAGVGWLLPIGERPRAMLLLGRRLSGPWLSLRETRDLGRFAGHLDVLLENTALREAASAHGAMDRALTRAGAIQARLLPGHLPSDERLDCAAATLSCEAVGGDYYDAVDAGAGQLALAIGDAAGKGVPAALMGVWAQATFRSRARRGAGPGRILTELNRELVALDQPEAFVALLCARLDTRRGELRFANAGVTPPLLLRADGRCRELTAGGTLLGVLRDANYADTRVRLGAGDVMVLYTDGLTEARRGDELFGVERLRDALRRLDGAPAAEIVRGLVANVQAWADHPLDDMTVVVLRQLARAARGLPRVRRSGLKWQPEAADTTG